MFGWFSFLQTLILTLVVIILLQIKIGESTLEQRTIQWYRTSNLAAPIQEVADGGAKLVRDVINKIADSVNIQIFEKVKDRPGHRDMGLRLERSKKFLEEQTKRAARKIQQELREEDTEPSKSNGRKNKIQRDWE
jgi:hypothetical protein